jgi:uncharacterized protein with HEPN domain
MNERVLKWLYDIDFAIQEIEGFFDTNEKNFITYKKNTMLKRAVERNLEIIGEAVKRILNADSSLENEITNSKAIIGLRNQVIHAYDSISDEAIWSILTNHLPKLKNEIDVLIKKSSEE